MRTVLTLNGGSSTIRFAMYEVDDTAKLLDGKIERVGAGTRMSVTAGKAGAAVTTQSNLEEAAGTSTAAYLAGWLAKHALATTVRGIGHRIVHGMQRSNPQRLTPELLDELRRNVSFDPEHLPKELELIDAVGRTHNKVPQVACFDTAFHRTMPRVASLLPIPRRFEARGVRRYGFHGLSYTYLMSELERLKDPAATRGRVILAHLGNGASMAAVRNGRSIDTSMGFTPTAGLVMNTRSGDLDPGVLGFLSSQESMDAMACQKMLTHESGLLGVSETSGDIRDLLASEATDVRAAEAVALFCYQARKWIGSFAAALGGLDTLVFAGGIGENSAEIRERICEGLEFLGVGLDKPRNSRHASIVSAEAARVTIRVIRTDEEAVIARATSSLLALGATKDAGLGNPTTPVVPDR